MKKIINQLLSSIIKNNLTTPIIKVKEIFTLKYISKTFSVNKSDLYFYSQPSLLILLKVAISIIVILKIYSLYSFFGDYFEKGVNFFKLEEIFNFKLPEKSFYYLISKILIIALIVYHSFFFFTKQIEAFFSSIVINKKDNRIYLIKSILLKKELYIYSLSQMNPFIVKQNLIFRLLNIGTIIFQNKNDEKIKIISIGKCKEAINNLVNA